MPSRSDTVTAFFSWDAAVGDAAEAWRTAGEDAVVCVGGLYVFRQV